MVNRRTLGLFPHVWRRLMMVSLAVQLIALYWPFQLNETASFPGADKVVHLSIFAAPALTGVLSGLRARWLALALAIHAPVSEFIQGTLINRDPSVYDALADIIGVVVGLVVGSVLRRSGTPL